MKEKNTSIIKMDEMKPIKQSNRLIEARYRLTMYEQRLIIAICSQLDENAEEFGKVRIKVSEIASFCNFEPQKAYSLVKKTIKKLASRILEIKLDDGSWYVTHWLQSAKYLSNDSVIEYKIDSELKPELLQLKSGFLRTQTKPLMEFRRDYSARMYFLMKKMLKVREFEYELDYFRDRFQLSKSYELSANLKNKVIDPAIKEINEKSDICVEHEYIKEGRTFTKIHFIVTSKEVELKISKNEDNEELSEELQKVVDMLSKRGVFITKAKELVKKYGKDRVIKNCRKAIQQKDTSYNLPGLIISFIEDDIAGQQDKEKERREKREKEREKEKREAYDFFYGTDMSSIGKGTVEEEKTDKNREDSLTPLEVEMIKKQAVEGKEISGFLANHMDDLGLTVNDVMKGKIK